MDRFDVATLEVQNLDQSTAIAIMMSGLLKNDLKKLLVKTYPQNLSNMLARVKKYARIEKTFTDETPIDLATVEPSKEHHPR